MKYLVLVMCVFLVACSSYSGSHSHSEKEKSIRHIEAPKVTSLNDAQRIFLAETAKIKSIKNFNDADLQELHLITYSLEQSIFYFVDNLTADRQADAKEMAVVVEDIHINSERNRQLQTQIYVKDYLKMAEKFTLGFN